MPPPAAPHSCAVPSEAMPRVTPRFKLVPPYRTALVFTLRLLKPSVPSWSTRRLTAAVWMYCAPVPVLVRERVSLLAAVTLPEVAEPYVDAVPKTPAKYSFSVPSTSSVSVLLELVSTRSVSTSLPTV